MNKNILYLVSGRKCTGITAHALINLYYLEKHLSYNFFLATPCPVPWQYENVELLEGLHHSYRGIHPFHIRKDLQRLATYCTTNNITMIHTFKWYDLIIALLLRRLYHTPLIHIHTLEVGNPYLLRPWQRLLLNYPSGLLIPGKKQDFLSSSSPPAAFLPPFIMPSLWTEQRYSPSLPLNLLIVSKLSKDRHWSLLLSALREIQTDNIHISLFGKGAYKSTLQQESKEMPVQVSFLGHKNLENAYKHADAGIILGTGSDGFCRTLFEFYAQHIPVIAPNYGVFREMVPEYQDNALFTTATDLRRILSDLTLRQLMQWHRTLQSFHAMYTPPKLALQYQEYYSSFF